MGSFVGLNARVAGWMAMVVVSVVGAGCDGGGSGEAETGGGAESLCGVSVAADLTQVLMDAGIDGYGFSAGNAFEGDRSGCYFDTVYNGEYAPSRSLQVVLVHDPAGDGSDECSWGYQTDSDSYSWCPEFEVYWSFYTEEFRGNSNRLDPATTQAVHAAFWSVIEDARADGWEPSDAKAELEAEEAAAAEAAAEAEAVDMTRDDAGCLTAETVSDIVARGFEDYGPVDGHSEVSAAGGSPADGCEYSLAGYPGSVLKVYERETGMGEFDMDEFDYWYDSSKQLVKDWAAEVAASGEYGPVTAEDGEYADWVTASGGTDLAHDGVFVGVLVSYGDQGEWVRDHAVIVDSMVDALASEHDPE